MPSDISTPEASVGGPSPPTGSSTALLGVPVELDCAELLSLDALYEYNPNVGTSTSVELSALTERVLGYDGLACGWSNQSSGEPITAAVARFAATDLEEIRAAAEANRGAQALPESAGSFWREGDVGTLEAFSGDYWIVIESPAFLETSDALQLLDSIQESLP
jgi:hypothetical protein